MSGIIQPLYTGIIAAAIAVSCVCLAVLFSQKPTEEQKFVNNVMCLVVLYLLGCLCYFVGTTREFLLLGFKLQCFAGFLIFMLTAMIFQQVYGVRVPGPVMMLLSLWSIFLLALVVTGSQSMQGAFFHQFYTRYNIWKLPDGRAMLRVQLGWGAYALVATQLVYLAFTVSLLVRALWAGVRGKYRVSVSFFPIVILPELAILLAFAFRDSLAVTPVFPLLAIPCSIGATVLGVRQVFTNLYDLSYSAIMDSMQDPLFVVDGRLNVRNVNKAARVLYPEYEGLDGKGTDERRVARELEDIIMPPPRGADEGILHLAGNAYEPEKHTIQRNGKVYGYLVVLHDITARHHKYTELESANRRLSHDMQSTEARIQAMREKMVSGSLQFVMDKHALTGEHMRRVSNYAFAVAKELQREGRFPDVLTDEYIEILCQVAPLHDVGKFLIPEDILGKADLADDEKLLLKSHVLLGAKAVDRMIINNKADPYYRMARDVTLYHHEKWNGKGYPEGLSGDAIPLAARIVAVADVFDKVSTRQAERNAWRFDEAVRAIRTRSGTAFDPAVVEAFENASLKVKYLYEQTFLSERRAFPEENGGEAFPDVLT